MWDFCQNEYMNRMDKDDLYIRVCSTVLELDYNQGRLNWTFSQVSRKSGVTRTLIYYYFGKEKEIVLNEAYRFMAVYLFNTGVGEKSGSVKTRLKKVLGTLETKPFLFHLYYQKKSEDSEVGEFIRHSELQLLNYLHSIHPGLSKMQVLKLYLLELGAISFRLSPAQVDKVFESFT